MPHIEHYPVVVKIGRGVRGAGKVRVKHVKAVRTEKTLR